MKKLWILPLLLLCLLLGACQSAEHGTYTSNLKLNISHITEEDATKNIQISYPVFGGIDNKEAITIINASISNYVNSEYEEFQNALITPNQDVLSAADTTANDEEGSAEDSETDEESDETDTTDEDTATTTEDGETTDGDGTAPTEKKQEQITLLMNFKITYNKNDYLCVVQSYEKTLTDNVKFNGQRSFFFSLGNATYLSLAEVFDFDNGFADYVNEKIQKQLDEGAYTTYDGDSGFTGISKSCNFYIDSKNLYIYYNALEISPDKDIIPTFVFNLNDVKEYITEDYANIL